MVISSSVYLTFEVVLNTQIEVIVSAPSLPINMVRIKISFPATPRSGVMPVERPTVPNADVTSNKICIKEYSGSQTHSARVPRLTTSRDKKATIKAFDMTSSDIFL